MAHTHRHYAEYIPEAGAPKPVVSASTRSRISQQAVRPIIVRNGGTPAAAPSPLVSKPRRATRPARAIVVKGGGTQGAPAPIVSRGAIRRQAPKPTVVRGGVARGAAPLPQIVVPRRRPGRPQLAIIISSHPTPAPPQQADSWISIDTAGAGVIPPAASYLRLEVEVA